MYFGVGGQHISMSQGPNTTSNSGDGKSDSARPHTTTRGTVGEAHNYVQCALSQLAGKVARWQPGAAASRIHDARSAGLLHHLKQVAVTSEDQNGRLQSVLHCGLQ